MTQEELWQRRYEAVVDFIEANHRNPSKFDGAERELRNWVKHQRKLLNAGALKAERVERFEELIVLMATYRRKNQYEPTHECGVVDGAAIIV